MNYPNTFKQFSPDVLVEYPEVFDPALKQFPRAFRQGEPAFLDAVTEARWRAARERVLDRAIRAIAESRWRENLVLRGSTLMKQWFGDSAREPGDVDWVVQPRLIRIDDPWTRDLFDGLKQLLVDDSVADDAAVFIDDVRVDDIWTYDRVPGRRIVYYWRTNFTPPGSLQMDFVFGEECWSPPMLTDIEMLRGANVTLWTATPELSLAWKLQWLDNDMYPQGKDLYDAVLLAEKQKRVSGELINHAFADRISRSRNSKLTAEVPLEWHVDWASFQKEYPWIKGEGADWQKRLANALRGSFACT